jgi:hypothetical protein
MPTAKSVGELSGGTVLDKRQNRYRRTTNVPSARKMGRKGPLRLKSFKASIAAKAPAASAS